MSFNAFSSVVFVTYIQAWAHGAASGFVIYVRTPCSFQFSVRTPRRMKLLLLKTTADLLMTLSTYDRTCFLCNVRRFDCQIDRHCCARLHSSCALTLYCCKFAHLFSVIKWNSIAIGPQSLETSAELVVCVFLTASVSNTRSCLQHPWSKRINMRVDPAEVSLTNRPKCRLIVKHSTQLLLPDSKISLVSLIILVTEIVYVHSNIYSWHFDGDSGRTTCR